MMTLESWSPGLLCCDGHSGLGVRLKKWSGRVLLMVTHEVDGHHAAGDRKQDPAARFRRYRFRC